jgi:OOP family OmpA-OmpF porin
MKTERRKFVTISNRQFSVVCALVLAGIMVLSGCATKKYVRAQIETVQPAIREAQDAAKENAERIDAVDRRAQQGISAAAAADQKAGQAQAAAETAQSAAQTADRKADAANQGLFQTDNRISSLETVVNNIDTLDKYTQSETRGVMFAFNSSALSNAAAGTLENIANSVAGMQGGYMLELEGFTDSVGSEQYNIGLSQRRAESVQRYLVGKNIPPYRISIVGLGKQNPVADNKTRQGRDQNRRVEVRVLKAPGARQAN